MSNRPLASIGLPVYNGERFLPALLDSLLAQTYENFELIISDNASTDSTVAICDEYAKRDSRIAVHRSATNRGSGWNHRRVTELASGPYFKWCGADDIVDPRFLELTVAALEQRPDAVMAYPLTVVIDDFGQEIKRTTERLPVSSPDIAQRFRALLRPASVTQSLFYGVFRKSFMSMARPMGAFLAADRCLLGELALLGPFILVEEFLMYRRIHVGHRTRSREDEQRLYVPDDSHSFQAREFGVLRESLISVARAPVGAGTRGRLLATVAKWSIDERRNFFAETKEALKQTVRTTSRRLGVLSKPRDESGTESGR